MSRKVGIIFFSLIETLVNAGALVLWLQKPEGGLFTPNKIAAYVVWIIGFTYEHIVAFNVGRGRPLFQDPDNPK